MLGDRAFLKTSSLPEKKALDVYPAVMAKDILSEYDIERDFVICAFSAAQIAFFLHFHCPDFNAIFVQSIFLFVIHVIWHKIVSDKPPQLLPCGK